MSTNRGRLTTNGTEGRVYGGDPNLIHVPDGKRREFGKRMALELDTLMRMEAQQRTLTERLGQALCPGCYMVVGFNMLVELAMQNGQSLKELGRTMAEAFSALAENANDPGMESIQIMLDPEEELEPA